MSSMRSFGDSLEKIGKLKEVNEEAHKLGLKLLEKMKGQISGGMRAYFVGSNFYKIVAINNDLDFLVEYATADEREKWKIFLTKYFGKPAHESYKFIKWESIYEGFPVEVLLSHPKFKIFRNAFFSYDILSNNPEILAEYEELKRSSAGVTVREYNRRQLYFFQYYVKDKIARRK